MLDVLLDALFDSLKVLALTYIIFIIISFFDNKINKILKKDSSSNPFFASLFGLIPQCGVSVLASDLYIKEYITMGTLVAVFFSCSDEALPMLFTQKDKLIYVIPLLLIKFIIGFALGFLTDLIVRRKTNRFNPYANKKNNKNLVNVKNNNKQDDGADPAFCCKYCATNTVSKPKKHFLHPLLHSLKIFAYVLAVNVVFSIIMYYVGDNVSKFLADSTWLSPLFTVLIGLIPNCASSMLISEMFLSGSICFGALVTGLCVNAGLGIMYLFKKKHGIKDILICVSILMCASLLTGYATMLIMMLF